MGLIERDEVRKILKLAGREVMASVSVSRVPPIHVVAQSLREEGEREIL